MTRPLRVSVLVPYPTGHAPSQRFRIEQWAPRLREHGVHCEIASFLDLCLFQQVTKSGAPIAKATGLVKAAMRRWNTVKTGIGDCDLVLLHREAMVFGPALVERMLARRKPFVFDFDDSIWLSNDNRINPLAKWVKFPGKTRTITALARAVLAGNDYLAQWAKRYNAAVHVVPTTIDTDGEYRRYKDHGRTDVPVIGWMGTSSTLRYLEFLIPVLQDVATRRRFRLLVIYDGPPLAWRGLDVEWRRWSSAREVDDLLSMDIGLMPQPDEEWAKGKCGAKALQYMAVGIPPVTSANGVLPEIVEHGHSGFLAQYPSEWGDELSTLIDDWKLRAAMGEHARATVAERYSAAVHVPRIADVLKSAAAARDG